MLDNMSLAVEEAVHELAAIFLESLESIGVSTLCQRSSSKVVEKDKDRKLDVSRVDKDKEVPREKTPKQPDEKSINEEIDELILYFNQRNFEALLRASRNALDGMKRRLFCTRYYFYSLSAPSFSFVLIVTSVLNNRIACLGTGGVYALALCWFLYCEHSLFAQNKFSHSENFTHLPLNVLNHHFR